MQNVLIVGAGAGGCAILRILKESSTMRAVAVVDIDNQAPGLQQARAAGIATGSSWKDFLDTSIDIIVEVTGDERVLQQLREAKPANSVVIPGSVAYMIASLMEEKESLISKLKSETEKHHLILNSTNDGMIVVDRAGSIIFFNRSASRMTEYPQSEAEGKHILDVIPTSELPRVLESRRMETNRKTVLKNGLQIIATRIPLINAEKQLIGAISIFKDTTDAVRLAEEVTNLKEIQTMLQAIIQSSDEAISVVDENGRGILINPAYTRITGLTEGQVIGKPANTDISEGESVHLKVLNTRKAVRGVKMRVGPQKKEVIVNVAPIIVHGKLQGSVGVIHDVSEIETLTKELHRARQIIRTLEAKYTFADIIGSSDEMSLAIEQAKLGAKTPATVLLRGESGTGKELFAHAIHNASDRKYNKFVRVNCAAIAETLLESELFGYEEGAFSGAARGGKKGFFEEANNGSIFLDEIGELSANTQPKLLRVLQEGEIVRVGGVKPIPINVRVIAATNVNLEKGIAQGSFREDLYYRLNRMPIQIPPLRSRKSDIPLLCERLIHKLNQDYGRNIEGIAEGALKRLTEYNWPGNVRELENILGRAIIFMHHNETYISEQHLMVFSSGREREGEQSRHIAVPDNRTLQAVLDDYEQQVIRAVLNENGGNKTAAARKLGISVRSLYYKLEKGPPAQ